MLAFFDIVEKNPSVPLLTANIRNDLRNPANDGNKILRMSEHFTSIQDARKIFISNVHERKWCSKYTTGV